MSGTILGSPIFGNYHIYIYTYVHMSYSILARQPSRVPQVLQLHRWRVSNWRVDGGRDKGKYPEPPGDLKSGSLNPGPHATKATLEELLSGIYFLDTPAQMGW